MGERAERLKHILENSSGRNEGDSFASPVPPSHPSPVTSLQSAAVREPDPPPGPASQRCWTRDPAPPPPRQPLRPMSEVFTNSTALKQPPGASQTESRPGRPVSEIYSRSQSSFTIPAPAPAPEPETDWRSSMRRMQEQIREVAELPRVEAVPARLAASKQGPGSASSPGRLNYHRVLGGERSNAH